VEEVAVQLGEGVLAPVLVQDWVVGVQL